MYVNAQLRPLADLCDQIVDGLPRHRPALAEKEVQRTGIAALLTGAQPGAQSAQFVAFDGLMSGETAFLPSDIEASGFQIKVFETQVHQFRDAQPVSVGHQHHQMVTPSVTTMPGGFQKTFHLGFREEVFAATVDGLFFPVCLHL